MPVELRIHPVHSAKITHCCSVMTYEQVRNQRMTSVEEWRAKAFALGGPFGNVLSRSYDLIHTVIRDGVEDDNTVSYALESLSKERELAINRDPLRDDQSRHLVYGLMESMGTMLEAIRDERRGMVAPVTGTVPPTNEWSNDHGDGSAHDSLPLFKNEVEDPTALAAVAKEENQDSSQEQPMSREAFLQSMEDMGKEEGGDEKADDQKEQEKEEEQDDDDEPCTSKQASSVQRSARKRVVMDSDESDGDYDASNDKEVRRSQSTPTDSRLRPRKNQSRDRSTSQRRSTRSCTSGPKRYGNDDEDEDEVMKTPRKRPAGETVTTLAKRLRAAAQHICDQCGQEFKCSRSLRNHTFKHNNIQCPYCTTFVASDEQLEEHIEKFHRKKEKIRSPYAKAHYDSDDSEADFLNDGEDDEEEEGEDKEWSPYEDEEPVKRRRSARVKKNEFVFD